ncbi:MAG: GNAT family N-acetyltransferase [Steroidobacteraceae bacterium]
MTIETTTVLVNDRWVTIRPIRSTDAAMEMDFVRKLSAAAKHYRFLCALNELSPAEAGRFCDIDGPHTMAFVATVEEEGREVEIGVCRYALGGKSDARETAITVADEWQQTELAKLLMEHLLASARKFGIRRLYTTEFADNYAMRSLAQDFGMSAERDPGDATQVIYSLGL